MSYQFAVFIVLVVLSYGFGFLSCFLACCDPDDDSFWISFKQSREDFTEWLKQLEEKK